VATLFRFGKFSRRNQAGTAAIEFGLAVPLLALLLMGIAELGFGMYQALQVSYAAEAGLLYAAVNGWNASGIANAAASATSLPGLTVTPSQFCGCPRPSGITAVSCNGSCGAEPASQYIQIGVSLPRRSLIVNSGLGLPSTISAQSILRQN
jgi:Flp pilus assembly protein TadG